MYMNIIKCIKQNNISFFLQYSDIVMHDEKEATKEDVTKAISSAENYKNEANDFFKSKEKLKTL